MVLVIQNAIAAIAEGFVGERTSDGEYAGESSTAVGNSDRRALSTLPPEPKY